MELRQLRYFVAVAEELHFGKAARRLYVSQPTLSQQLRVLERGLGTALLVRDRRHVELTTAGEVLLVHARQTLTAAAEAVLAVRQVGATAGRELRVGIYATVPVELVKATVGAFATRNPGLRLVAKNLSFADFQPALLSRAVDIAFVRPPVDDERLEVRPLLEEPRVVCLSRDHAMADADELDANDLLDHAIIAPPVAAPASWVDFWQLGALRNGDRPQVIGESVVGMPDLLAQIAETNGVITTSASGARQFSHPGVTAVTLRGQPCQVAIATPRGPLSATTASFLATARKIAATVGSQLVPHAISLNQPETPPC